MMALKNDILYSVRVVNSLLKKETQDERLSVFQREDHAGPLCSGVLPNLKVMRDFQRYLVKLSFISQESFSRCTTQISKMISLWTFHANHSASGLFSHSKNRNARLLKVRSFMNPCYCKYRKRSTREGQSGRSGIVPKAIINQL